VESLQSQLDAKTQTTDILISGGECRLHQVFENMLVMLVAFD
jgi:hypothetical protein